MTQATRSRASGQPVFELSGGALCLDLTNTLSGRRNDPRERLGSYTDLVSWARQAGILTDAEARCLLDEADRRPDRARAALRKVKTLREAIYSVFSSVALGAKPPPEDLERLNSAIPVSFARMTIEPGSQGFRWSWNPCGRDLSGIIHPVVESASELLTSDELRRVRICEAGDCAWLFLDRSRNRTRRWCDMAACGNRAKARRHYHRVKGRPDPRRR